MTFEKLHSLRRVRKGEGATSFLGSGRLVFMTSFFCYNGIKKGANLMATEAQLRASKKYQDKHKEDVKFNTKKSHAKWFIKNSDISRLDDLKELRELINSRIEQLENEK